MEQPKNMSQQGLIRTTVHRAIRQLYRWLEQYVSGFEMDKEELHAWALYITAELQGELLAKQQNQLSQRQHRLAAQPASGLSLEQFIFRAIVGPVGLKANSISKGMLFPYLEQHGLRKVLVEFKRCPVCGKMAEADACPTVNCETLFSAQTTPAIGREWLILEGIYLPVRRWGCRYQTETGGAVQQHYHRQNNCKDTLAPTSDERRYRVSHGRIHDTCPWKDCPNHGSRHGQRGTTLWVRAELAGVASTPPSLPLNILECLTEGVQRVRETLTSRECALLNRLGEHDEAIVDALIEEGAEVARFRRAFPEFSSTELNDLLDEVRPKVIEVLRRLMEERGFDEQTVIEHLRVGRHVADG